MKQIIILLESNEGETFGLAGGGFEGVTLGGVVYFLVKLNNPDVTFLPNLDIIVFIVYLLFSDNQQQNLGIN